MPEQDAFQARIYIVVCVCVCFVRLSSGKLAGLPVLILQVSGPTGVSFLWFCPGLPVG